MNDHPPIRVLVADDQPMVRDSLATIIDAAVGMQTVATASNGQEAVRIARRLRPDVILMDIRMPIMDGIAATQSIVSVPELANCRVLVLTMFDLDEYVYGALKAGASGFLLKDTPPDRLIEAVRRTHSGESLFAPAVTTMLVAHYVKRADYAQSPETRPDLRWVTPREAEVLRLIAQGFSNDEIAETLVISIKTVKTHIGSLLAKLHARDRAQLVIAAYQGGLFCQPFG